MEKRKAVQDAEVASKTIAGKGLLMVHTGSGKGNSTAAFGLAVRALGHGWKVGVVQFGKGAWQSGERAMLEQLGQTLVSWHTLGEGFTWETQDRARDEAAAHRAWEKALELMADARLRLLVLDELNIALRYEHLPLGAIVAALRGRRRFACRGDRPQRAAGADRGGRSCHRDDAGQTSFQGRRESAGRNRVLNAAARTAYEERFGAGNFVLTSPRLRANRFGASQHGFSFLIRCLLEANDIIRKHLTNRAQSIGSRRGRRFVRAATTQFE